MNDSSNIRIIAKSILDDTALENSDTDVLYPLNNLQIPQTSLKWRTETVAEQQIISDIMQYTPVSGWSMHGHNLSFGSTVRLTLYTSINRDRAVSDITFAAGVATVTLSQLHGMYNDGSEYAVRLSGLVGADELNDKVWDCRVISLNAVEIDIDALTPYVSGGLLTSLREEYDAIQDGLPIQYGWGLQPWGLGGWYGYGTDTKRQDYVNFWFDNIITDYMRVIIKDTSNPDGYVQAGRMILGLSMNPTYNFSWGAGIDYRSQTKVARTRSGSLISDNRPSYRVADFELNFLTEAEAMLLLDMMDNPGLRSDALISMYPDHKGLLGQRTTILGRFINHSPIARQITGYTLSITFEEAL